MDCRVFSLIFLYRSAFMLNSVKKRRGAGRHIQAAPSSAAKSASRPKGGNDTEK